MGVFKKAERFGGSFLDLKQVAIDGPQLVLFRVQTFHDVEKSTGFEGWTLPVTADAMICSGPRKGEVHLGERFIGAITSVLRGVKNPRKDKGETPQDPTNDEGDLILARVEVINPGKNNAAAVGNVPSDADVEAVEAFYTPESWNSVPEQRTEVKAAATAGASKRPWD